MDAGNGYEPVASMLRSRPRARPITWSQPDDTWTGCAQAFEQNNQWRRAGEMSHLLIPAVMPAPEKKEWVHKACYQLPL